MKRFLLILSLLLTFSFQAKATEDDRIISDKEQQCKIHYLSSTPKEMWYIKTDNNCPNGWVEGFANVRLFDLFNTEVSTISGFFKQGYWLDQFTSLEKPMFYSSLNENTKTLTFLIDTDQPSNTQFFALFRSVQEKDRAYPAFSLCKKSAYFLIVHPYIEDFKNTAFQARIFKQIRQEAQILCPTIQRLIILGVTSAQSKSSDWIFHADMDISTGQTNLRYKSTTQNTQEEKPSELRQEKAEAIVSITTSPTTIHADYGNIPSIKQTNNTSYTKNSDQLWDYTNYNYSALDLALLTKITPQPIQGKAVMHIASVALDGTGFVDKPYPILLLHTTDLKIGWAKVQGTFSVQNNKLTVKPLIVYPCTQEWCHEK